MTINVHNVITALSPKTPAVAWRNAILLKRAQHLSGICQAAASLDPAWQDPEGADAALALSVWRRRPMKCL